MILQKLRSDAEAKLGDRTTQVRSDIESMVRDVWHAP